MSISHSHQRMINNESVFRHYNEQVRKNFEEIVKLAKESGQDDLIRDDDTPLHFYCECSDENCHQRILLKPSEYAKIHENRKLFVLKPGHEASRIERIVDAEASHFVVEKFVKPSETARVLKPTAVDNS